MMLSIVIPSFNDSQNLSKTLSLISSSTKSMEVEVIVVDGGSTDTSAEIAISYGAKLVKSVKGRGNQLSAGVNSSAGAWLLILHADTRPQSGWVTVIKRFITNPSNRFYAAHFIFGLDDNSNKARLLERAVHWRSTIFKAPYGDQGLLISREFYKIIGGYPEIPIMEDIAILRKIKSNRVKQLPIVATTSAARYQYDGYLKRSFKNFTCRFLHLLGVPETLIEGVYESDNVVS